MRKFFALFLTGLCVSGINSVASADVTYKTMPINIQDAYIPSGFTSDVEAFVVESGYYPNGCYHWDHAEVTNPTTMLHEIRSFAKVSSGPCPMILMMFHREINLGKLAVGAHTVRFMNGDGTYMEKSLSIEQ